MVIDGLAERAGDPLRGRLVQRLACEKQVAQAGNVVLVQVCGILLLENANSRGRREHHGHFVVLHDLPPDAGIGTDREALVDDSCHARISGP